MYVKKYLDEKYYLHDMIHQHCELSTTPIFHSSLENIIECTCITNRQFERNLEMTHQYRKLGYHDFYTVPCKSLLGNHHSMFSITEKDLNQEQFYSLVMRHHTIIYLSANAIDVIGSTNFPKFFPVQLQRERIYKPSKSLQLVETLVKKDYTLKQVAADLHISIRTANNRVEEFKNALGVRTMSGAVYLALKKGLISLEDQGLQQHHYIAHHVANETG